MFEIISKQILAEDIKKIDIYAPHIAQKVKPGQFVSVCPEEGDEKIPLTVTESDLRKGSISLIFREIGETTGKLGTLPINESIFAIVGPLGVESQIKKYGNVVCIATGVGCAQILPICRALKKENNKVIGIIGAKTKRKLMLEPQMRLSCNKLYITTEDGSYDRKGLATDIFQKILAEENIQLVYAIGSVEMMMNVCKLTKPKKIKTLVQLNPIMVDCMGMCGSCRVKVGGHLITACTKGPEFDGHKVDFDDYCLRQKAFKGRDQWVNQKLQSNQARKESGILTRFLSGFLKK